MQPSEKKYKNFKVKGEKTVARPRITQDELELLKQYRNDKKERKQAHKALAEECKEQGLPIEAVGTYWYKSKRFSVKLNTNNAVNYFDVRDETVKAMQEYAVVYPRIIRDKVKEPHLFYLDIADLHIGKYVNEAGEKYNVDIAVKRVADGVGELLQKVQHLEFDKIVITIGNDILHTDSPRRTTTSGTPQDTDGMWHENFVVARKLYVSIIEILLQIADVHIVFNPSNHDYMSGFMLADSVASWFHNNPNVTSDVSINHRKYFVYGTNLIGTTHGDGAKENELPDLMKVEAKKAYSLADHCTWFVHHIHHKVKNSYIGKLKENLERDIRDVTVIKSNNRKNPQDKVHVEYVRTPSASDSWHDRNGYTGNSQAIECFVFHQSQGQVARFTHFFK